MKSKPPKTQKDDFAARDAKLHGTKLYYWKNGEVVAEKPWHLGPID